MHLLKIEVLDLAWLITPNTGKCNSDIQFVALLIVKKLNYRTFYLERNGKSREALERPAEVTTLARKTGSHCPTRKAGSRNLSSEIFSLPSGFVRHWAPHWDTHGASEA